MTDSELKQAAETALQGNSRLSGRKIQVLVANGRVELQGTVEGLAEKRLALNLVRQLRMGAEIRDSLRLPAAHELSDAQICQHVEDAVIQDSNLHEQQLRVAVTEGVVILTGWVNSLEEKRLMGLSAWWVPGVADVDNRIDVLPEQAGDDGDLVDVIKLAFEKDVLVDAGSVGVEARGGVVTLTGTVRSEDERMAAEHDAYYIWGVEEVNNQLAVASL